MALPLGIFDSTLIPGGWFDATAPNAAAEFDRTLGTVATGGTVYNDSVTETASAADALAVSLMMSVSLSDGAAAADSVSTTAIFAAAVSEAASAGDSLSGTMTMAEVITESATAADSLDSTAVYFVSFAESVSATDAVTGDIAGQGPVTSGMMGWWG